MPVKYTKADLMWEATRRNEDYKNDYASMLEKYRADSKNNLDTTIEYLPYVPSNRWMISIIRETATSIKIFGWIDPCVDIDKIKKDISSGVPAVSVHPYAYTHELTRTNPNIYYHQIDQQYGQQYFSERPLEGDTYICIKKSFIRNKILFLIDPTSEDDSIMKSIQETKKRVLKCIKNQTDSLKQKGEMVFYPRDIEKYIGWLKKYDEIVEHQKKEQGKGGLIYADGALIVPGDFRFAELVPNDTPGNKFEGQRKAYRDAYHGAVKLIQTTPAIVFSPSRT